MNDSSLDFPKQMVQTILHGLDEGERNAYRTVWMWTEQFVAEHWGLILAVLGFILLLAIIEYLITRRWAMLGSVLYHYFFAICLIIITMIFGPEIYAGAWSKVILFLVYVLCFWLVGRFLEKVGAKKTPKVSNLSKF